MDISSILSLRSIAIIGLSDKPERDSYRVAEYLIDHGYEITPVNPMIKEWNGLKAYPDLLSIPKEKKIDIVDIFRKSEFVPEVVEQAIKIKAKVVWMQLGVVNAKAAEKAEQAGLAVVMDKCIKIEHTKILT